MDFLPSGRAGVVQGEYSNTRKLSFRFKYAGLIAFSTFDDFDCLIDLSLIYTITQSLVNGTLHTLTQLSFGHLA